MARKCVIHNTYTPFFVLLAGLEPVTSPFSPFLAKDPRFSVRRHEETGRGGAFMVPFGAQ